MAHDHLGDELVPANAERIECVCVCGGGLVW